MPVIETTLHASYQQNEWHLREAIREIISNAIDGEERGKASGTGQMTLEYSRRRKVLTVSNSNVKVPARALLMGTSESRGNDDCIGTFGEGLPMALLVLARKGVPVTIYNGDEKWEPKIEQSSNFSGEPVLAIHTRQLIKDRQAFTVELGDLDQVDAEEVERMFLRLDKTFDPTQVASCGSWSRQRVLLQPEFCGRVYNKGVFVFRRDDLLFGYDLDVELNRDRHTMSDWKLQDQVGQVLSAAARNYNPHFLDALLTAVLSGKPSLELNDEYGGLAHNSGFCDSVVDHWRQRFGDAIAVGSISEVQEAEALGKKGMIVPALLRRIVSDRVGTLAAISRSEEEAVSYVHQSWELSEPERKTGERALELLGIEMELCSDQLRIVDFKSDKTMGTLMRSSHRINIARWVLGSLEQTILTVLHQYASHPDHADGRSRADVQVEILVRSLLRAGGEV